MQSESPHIQFHLLMRFAIYFNGHSNVACADFKGSSLVPTYGHFEPVACPSMPAASVPAASMLAASVLAASVLAASVLATSVLAASVVDALLTPETFVSQTFDA